MVVVLFILQVLQIFPVLIFEQKFDLGLSDNLRVLIATKRVLHSRELLKPLEIALCTLSWRGIQLPSVKKKK